MPLSKNGSLSSVLTFSLQKVFSFALPSITRADFIRVYGMQPRHWMPAYASMTIKGSFPRKRESRSRPYNCKPFLGYGGLCEGFKARGRTMLPCTYGGQNNMRGWTTVPV